MVYIITKNKPWHKQEKHVKQVQRDVLDTDNQRKWQKEKDALHSRRKRLEGEMRDGMFNKDQMMQRDLKHPADEAKRVSDYERWRDTSVKGVANSDRMAEWCRINKEFKNHKEEGKPLTMDNVRAKSKVRYD